MLETNSLNRVTVLLEKYGRNHKANILKLNIYFAVHAIKLAKIITFLDVLILNCNGMHSHTQPFEKSAETERHLAVLCRAEENA